MSDTFYAIHQYLNLLINAKTEDVIIPWFTYRTYLNMLEVPAIEKLKDRKGNIFSVKVNRLQAIDYIKKEYGFIEKDKLKKEIQDGYRS